MDFPHRPAERRLVEPFASRAAAGRELARQLRRFRGRSDVVVLALPRGGVPVAFEVADALDAPLDVFVVRKLGMPGNPEFALGAIASGGVRILNEDVLRWYAIPDSELELIVERELAELERREREYRLRPLTPLSGTTVILVDDGLATGSTMRAAVQAVRAQSPARVVVAVPVGAPSACDEIAEAADEVVCVRAPEAFAAVGAHYEEFAQTTDDEVRALLRQHAEQVAAREGRP